MSDSIRENRIALIRALESGEYAQTTGRLSNDLGEWSRHCCIGVQRRIATNQPEWEDETPEYGKFRQAIGDRGSLTEYLMAMNDGHGWKGRHNYGRNTMRRRDFPFIARFLRKVWRLTDA